jgi:hypothetical protein
MQNAANDNRSILFTTIDKAVPGQAITIAQAHRRNGRSYAEFVGHAGDGRHVFVRKLISGMWRSRWTKPMRVERAAIIAVHDVMAQAAA